MLSDTETSQLQPQTPRSPERNEKPLFYCHPFHVITYTVPRSWKSFNKNREELNERECLVVDTCDLVTGARNYAASRWVAAAGS